MSSSPAPAQNFNLRYIKDGRWLKDVRVDGSEARSWKREEALAFGEAGANHILDNLNHPLSDRPAGIRYEIVPA